MFDFIIALIISAAIAINMHQMKQDMEQIKMEINKPKYIEYIKIDSYEDAN